MGRPKDPHYWRKWRASHPAYREREKRRLADRKAAGLLGRGDRAAEARRRRERVRRASGDNGTTETWHPLLEQAKEVAIRHRRPDNRRVYLDPLHDDAVSVAVIALIEGVDPDEAVKAFIRSERTWRVMALPMLKDFAA